MQSLLNNGFAVTDWLLVISVSILFVEIIGLHYLLILTFGVESSDDHPLILCFVGF